jgi:hypothetical protein
MNTEQLKIQIEEQRNLLNTDRLDVSFGEIMRMYEDKEIVIKPAFQRYFRWDDGNFATALYDVITIGVAENYDYYKSQPSDVILNKINQEVRTDTILIKFSRRGGNNQKARIINRLREAKRIFGNINK